MRFPSPLGVLRSIVSLCLTLALIFVPSPGSLEVLANTVRSIPHLRISRSAQVGDQQINLDYMRANRPGELIPKDGTTDLPTGGYSDPIPSGGGGSKLNAYYTDQVDPGNSTGTAEGQTGQAPDPTTSGPISINLGSHNINFTAPVLSLGGRGLGLSLALSYNSKVWGSEGSNIFFNADRGFPGPGWRTGFGVVQGKQSGADVTYYTNGVTGKASYIYITPDGSRHDMAFNSTTGLYESYDSTYIDFNAFTKVMRLMDGTQVTFATAYAGQLLPTEVKDRNGNKITIVNAAISNGDGAASNGDVVIDYIIDTLGHEIDFYYESNRLVKIRQQRAAGWYDYVVIDYAEVTIATNFGTLTVDPAGLSKVWLPSRIDYPTGHNYRFYYTSYAQMWMVEKWVPTVSGEGSERRVSYTRYELPSFDGKSYPSNSLVSLDASAQTDCPQFKNRYEQAEFWNGGNEAKYSYYFDSAGSYSTVTDPSGRIYRSESSSGGVIQTTKVYQDAAKMGGDQWAKRVTIQYEYDWAGYRENLRVQQIKIEDGSNVRRRHYTYPWSGIRLPIDVAEYESGGTTIYRHTQTDYHTGSAYSSRHIYGLPSEVRLYKGDGTTNLISRKSFAYDESSGFDSTSYSVTQHDSTNYGTGFVAGRGNLTSVTEYDISGGGSRVIGKTKYDMTGSASSVTDAAGHTTEFFYTDNYTNKATGVGETHAFATKIKDGDGYWSGAKFDWENGLIKQSYHIAGTTGGGSAENVTSYSYSRGDRVAMVSYPTGGVTAWSYWDNWAAVAQYTKIDGAQTRYSFKSWDGAGQLKWEGADHPNASSGKYSIKMYGYDSVGRTSKVSNVTEVDASRNPIDDDAATGYQYTTISYDVLDRELVITRPDGNKVEKSYTGCGCAGSSSLMVTDERGKKRKVNHDFLGRLKEAQDLTSAGAIYGKAVYHYNDLDQLLKIEHYNDGSAHQDRTFSYDRYGRVTSETTPEGGTVSYEYYANDQVKKVSHAGKGTSITYSYNNRDLIKDVDYNDSTPDVHYEYGEYGERTVMQEKNSGGTVIASTSYSYDTYKRLQKETKGFNGFAGSYSVGYQYNYVGLTQVSYQVTNSANPGGWNKRVNYAYNYAGSLTGVGTDLIGIDPSSTTNVVKNLVYKGFGGIKSLSYGANPRKLALGYDQKRHQMTSLIVQKTDGTDSIIDQSYDYYNGSNNNGRIQKITDNVDSNYSTTYGYDDQNRLVSAQAKAYTRNYSYDNWGNLTGVTAGGASETGSYSLSYSTNASGAPATNQIKGYTYDAAGNLTNDGTQTLTYDAANRIKTTSVGGSEYDGDGRRVKQSASGYSTYYLWSSLLGEVAVEVNSDGTIYRAYVYGPGGGQVLAQQSYDGKFYWVHTDHLGSGKKLTDSSGAVVYRGEFDPHGQVVLESATGGATYLNSHKFTGYEREWATNLDYAKARAYSHNRARFMQPDPLSLGAADLTNPQSLNRYSYVGNDPVNRIDPSGLYYVAVYGKACVSIVGSGEGSCEEYLIGLIWVGDTGGGYDYSGYGGGNSGAGEYGGGGGGQNLPTPAPDTPRLPLPAPPSELVKSCNGSLSSNSQLSNTGLGLIKQFEGFSSALYNDSAGHCTIGYGHLLHKGACGGADGKLYGNGISMAAATELLRQDAADAVATVNQYVTVPLTQNQFDALVSFTFNVGGRALRTSTLLRELNNFNYGQASNEFLKWNRAGGQVIKGLTKRREGESLLFNNRCF